jgi:gliding motility-associated lipoprotein GldB
MNSFSRLFYFKVGIFCLFSFFLVSCSGNSQLETEINSIDVTIDIDRFDLNFYKANSEEYIQLKKKYPYLFPEQYPDSIWKKRQRDSIQVLLHEEIKKVYPTLIPIEEALEDLYKHIKYYFPSIKDPHVVTVVNNVDYQSKTVFTDSLLIISLDTYLGSKNPIYEGIPNYIVKDMESDYMTSHIVDELGTLVVRSPKDRTMLGQMVYYGKKLYLKDLLLPNASDDIKISYSKEEIEWVQDNERYMWQYFIENELLFQTQSSLSLRFIDPAPFSKFYLEIDNDTPGKVGQWIGWQIVRSYMDKNPNTSLEELLSMSARDLFNKSNYKPAK